jgi:hypothetical protein
VFILHRQPIVLLSEFVLKVNFKNTPDFNLNNVDPKNIDGVIKKIQTSFDIKLGNDDLQEAKTFDKLCDTVVEKVKHKNSDSCTTQQAFYKLRNAINNNVDADKELIKPQTRLCDIFPRDTRLQVIAEIEREMGFKMNLLRPKASIVFVFSAILVISIIAVFFNAEIGAAGIILSAAGLILAGKFGKEMQVKTLGDLAEKIAHEHYRSCKRNASTVNRNEIAGKVKELLVTEL